MRRLINRNASTGYTTVTELTLSSTTGVNKETYVSIANSENTANDRADTQTELLSGIVNSVGQLTKIVNGMNEQKQTSESPSMITRVIDVDIDNIYSTRQFISVNSDSVIIPDKTFVKSIKLDIEREFSANTQFILFFNNVILATVNVTDPSETAYEMTLNKYIEYANGMGNNMNVEVYTNPGDPSEDGWISPKATLHLTMGFTNNEI